jgi:hypothetical protein
MRRFYFLIVVGSLSFNSVSCSLLNQGYRDQITAKETEIKILQSQIKSTSTPPDALQGLKDQLAQAQKDVADLKVTATKEVVNKAASAGLNIAGYLGPLAGTLFPPAAGIIALIAAALTAAKDATAKKVVA